MRSAKTGKLHRGIASDIHEGLAQRMAGILFAAKGLETKMSRENAPQLDDLTYLVTQIQAAQTEISQLITKLDGGKPR